MQCKENFSYAFVQEIWQNFHEQKNPRFFFFSMQHVDETEQKEQEIEDMFDKERDNLRKNHEEGVRKGLCYTTFKDSGSILL
jgi:hypothetical protein